MPRQFYNLPQRMFAVLRLLMKSMHQQIAILAVEGHLAGRCSQPVALRQILQKFSPLNGTTIINIYLLKQLDQFIANEMRLLLRLIQSLPHQPQKLIEIQPIIVIPKLSLDMIYTGIVERHDHMTHIVPILRIHH